jgi:uncharacterized protein
MLAIQRAYHRTALNWLNRAIADWAVGGAIALLPMVVASFLRVTTNMKIFLTPAPIGDAVAFVDALLAVPGVEIPELGREWPTLRSLRVERLLCYFATPMVVEHGIH